jgi:hypothetical protein
VYYFFWPPCKTDPGPDPTLGILFSSAGIVTRASWEWSPVWNGPMGCIP